MIRRPPGDGLKVFLVSACLGLLTYPRAWRVGDPSAWRVPSAELDPSWGYAVHWQVDHAWITGSGGFPVTFFTYGPLGFLGAPTAWSRLSYTAAAVFAVLLQVLLCGLVFTRLRRLCPAAVAVGLTFLLGALAPLGSPEVLLVVAVLAAAQVLQGRSVVRRPWLVAGSLAVGLALLIKFSTGVALLAVLAVVAFATSGPRRTTRALTSAACSAGALVTAWVGFGLLSGHPWGYLTWLQGSREVATGYAAMSDAQPGTVGSAAAALLLFAFAITGVLLARRSETLHRRASVLVVLLAVYVLFRLGFTRHDGPHEGQFLSAVALLPLALPTGRQWRWFLPPLVVLPVWLGVTHDDIRLGERYQVLSTLHEAGKTWGTLIDASGVQAAGARGMRASYPMPDPVVQALRGHRVQVDPYNTGRLWADRLDWGPSAVWALYSAYTPWLDDRNASSISVSSGPDRILRYAGAEPVDDRNPDFESPRYQLTEQCRWQTDVVDGPWQVLRPGPDRCGKPMPLGTVRFSPGRAVVVPRPRAAGSIVTVRLALSTSWLTRLETMALKPLRDRTIVIDHNRYRLVVANAGQPLVLELPPGVPGSARTFAPLSARSLVLDAAGEAVFEEVPVSP